MYRNKAYTMKVNIYNIEDIDISRHSEYMLYNTPICKLYKYAKQKG